MRLILFDLDNTLLDGDSDFAWAEFLIQKGALARDTQEEKNRRFLADYEAGMLDIEAFLAFQLAPLAAHPRATLEEWRAEFMKEVIPPMITPAARTLARDHLAEKDALTILVTATNGFITVPIARELGFAHIIATIPECVQGEFTGKVRGVPAFREGKLVRVGAWLESQAFYWGSFSETCFYSDSHNDLPLLEKVSRPIAVNPDPHLLEIATERKWGILQLRHNNAGNSPL